MIVDSTILVDAIRGKSKASLFLESAREKLIVSQAGMMEFIRGARTRRDIIVIDKFMKGIQVEVVEITEEISREAGVIFRKFWHSHGIGVMDAFIASTALVLNERVATHNIKHFKQIKGLDLIVPY